MAPGLFCGGLCGLDDISAPAAGLPVAGVAELVDARDLESRDESRGGSSPSARTSWAVSPELRPRAWANMPATAKYLVRKMGREE